MRRITSGAVSLGAACALALGTIMASAVGVAAQDTTATVPASYQPMTADQLDSLVAPIALYADPLLAQVLLASTFPDQIQQAESYVEANGTAGIADQYWDVSVKAVAHYPTILNSMASNMDWTTALGQAYAAQSTDVMDAVQHMRQLAQAQGNLVSTPQQQVVTNDGYISVWPAQPQYIYVPVYNPAVVYYEPAYAGFGITFGVGFPIGPWLVYDWDWPAHCIYYTGWMGGGWIARSRPFIRFTGVYVNAGYRHVSYNPNVFYWRNGHGYTNGYASPRPHGVMTPGGYRSGDQRGGRAATGRQAGYSSNSWPRRVEAYRPVQRGLIEQRTARPVSSSGRRPAYGTTPRSAESVPTYRATPVRTYRPSVPTYRATPVRSYRAPVPTYRATPVPRAGGPARGWSAPRAAPGRAVRSSGGPRGHVSMPRASRGGRTGQRGGSRHGR